MKQNECTSKGSNDKIPTIEKWYGYYTAKTIPEIITETNKQYNSQVHDFFLDHNLWDLPTKHQNVFYTKGKNNRLQYFCNICGFTYSYCSLHAIRLHCFQEHRDEVKSRA